MFWEEDEELVFNSPDEIIAQEIREGKDWAKAILRESSLDTFKCVLLKETAKAYYVEIIPNKKTKRPNLKVWFPKKFSRLSGNSSFIKVYRPIAMKNVIRSYHQQEIAPKKN